VAAAMGATSRDPRGAARTQTACSSDLENSHGQPALDRNLSQTRLHSFQGAAASSDTSKAGWAWLRRTRVLVKGLELDLVKRLKRKDQVVREQRRRRLSLQKTGRLFHAAGASSKPE